MTNWHQRLKRRKQYKMLKQKSTFLLLLLGVLAVHGLGLQAGASSSHFFFNQPEYPRDCYEVQIQCSSSNSSGVHLIRPDGYAEPFEAYCEISQNDGDWTVIQRRSDGSINFNRNWEDYKIGFGFLSHEYWLGNEKLSYLTNQKEYQLRIDMSLANGSSFQVTYNKFRISDGFGKYKIVDVGHHNRKDLSIKWCPPNMVYGNCTCQRTCQYPDNCGDCAGVESCVCPDGFLMNGNDCVHQNQCTCYIEEAVTDIVLSVGDLYVSQNCERRCTCIDDRLSCNDYQCSPNAACEIRNNLRQCYCNAGYAGDGVQCTSTVRLDCQDIYDNGETDSGVYRIKPTGWGGSPFEVYCNMSDGGGWTVFQRRVDNSQSFHLYWADYKAGFGSPSRNVWLGNDKLYSLTNQRRYELRVDLVNRNHLTYYAKYDFFRISNENDNYTQDIGSYSGTAGDSMSREDNWPFTTRDRDHDDHSGFNCATLWGGHCGTTYENGGWWYGTCSLAVLNNVYGSCLFSWHHIPGSNNPGYYLKYSEMKIRPV